MGLLIVNCEFSADIEQARELPADRPVFGEVEQTRRLDTVGFILAPIEQTCGSKTVNIVFAPVEHSRRLNARGLAGHVSDTGELDAVGVVVGPVGSRAHLNAVLALVRNIDTAADVQSNDHGVLSPEDIGAQSEDVVAASEKRGRRDE